MTISTGRELNKAKVSLGHLLSYTSAILEMFYFKDLHDYITLENRVAPRDG